MTVSIDEANNNSALVNRDWLRQNLESSDLVILDATFFLPRQRRNAQEEFRLLHIPGAHFFDIDEIADLSSPLPHSLPSAEQFAEQVGRLGVGNDNWVIVYDNNHFFAAARVWWMFRVFGHNKVKILNGGLTTWQNRSFPLTSETATPISKLFNAVFHPELFANLQQMRMMQQQASMQILDARSQDSFYGQRHLTGPSLKPRHIPGSINIPYQDLFANDDHTLLPVGQLRRIIADAEVNFSEPMVTSCGSGVSAALLLLALFEIGFHDVPMYDGSWAEWSRESDIAGQ